MDVLGHIPDASSYSSHTLMLHEPWSVGWTLVLTNDLAGQGGTVPSLITDTEVPVLLVEVVESQQSQMGGLRTVTGSVPAKDPELLEVAEMDQGQ